MAERSVLLGRSSPRSEWAAATLFLPQLAQHRLDGAVVEAAVEVAHGVEGGGVCAFGNEEGERAKIGVPFDKTALQRAGWVEQQEWVLITCDDEFARQVEIGDAHHDVHDLFVVA